MLLDETIERQSICELELDCVSENILNPNLDKGKKRIIYINPNKTIEY